MDEEQRVNDALEGLSVNTNGIIRQLNAVKEENADSISSTPILSSKGPNSRSLSPDVAKSQSDSASTPEVAPRPKMSSRKASQKAAPVPATLFTHLPDVTADSKEHFEVIENCMYGSKTLGSSKQDALDCDCSEEWHDGVNHACADDSCINRATKMECVDKDCNCGNDCQNQRFQRKQYANVSVIKTDKKGYGLRANANLQSGDFIFEYIGEVINEPTFRQRMLRYDNEGIKHFYFMSLTKSEFVDATKKGNLGRFCNHSCNPNCYVDKWVVGKKLRMGIFAGRNIQAGEELVFNYNVDRYGADPQPCYCGEPNCIGFIGGKTQTERATKLPDATIEALGIDDGDGWDTAVAKKPRKKKADEDDEEYVNSVQARGLDEKGVTKVMAALMQCKEKWIAVKLLERIQRCDDDRVRSRVVQMHGYQILKTTLTTFLEDHNIALQILDILYQFPRISKNKIVDSDIESTIKQLTSSEHQDVAEESTRLLEEWSKLEVAYRIPRKKLDPNSQGTPNNNSYEDRRGIRPEEPVTKAVTILPDNIPKGPRSNIPQRNPNFFNPHPRSRRPHNFQNLPPGWFTASDARGSVYYYTKSGQTTWRRPNAPAPDFASAQPTGPSKAQLEQKQLQDIIDNASKPSILARRSVSQTPQQAPTPTPEPKKEKWRSLPIEKQMKIYENTLFPHVKYVMDKFRHQLPKEDLKKFAKDVNKKLVASDYKNKRVDDPTTISEKQERKVKKFVKDFFERAVVKYKAHKQKSAEQAAKSEPSAAKSKNGAAPDVVTESPTTNLDEDIVMTDDEGPGSTPASSDRKRKRDDDAVDSPGPAPSETPSIKRVKDDDGDLPSPPPPPPPPPEGEATPTAEVSEQEAALMLENEEAQRIADEAEHQKLAEQEAELERENERNMLDFESGQQKPHPVNGNKDIAINGMLDPQGSTREKQEESGNALKQNTSRGHEVMSH